MHLLNLNRKSPTGGRGNRGRRRKRNRNCAVNNHDQLSNINRIEILPNASKFAVFSAIRAIVMESESKSQSLFDILENNKKMQCHQAAKQQDIDTDAESLMGDVTEKQITMAIPQVNFQIDSYLSSLTNHNKIKQFLSTDRRCWLKRSIRINR